MPVLLERDAELGRLATGLWNDTREGADCPAIDAYRQAFVRDAQSGATAARDADEPDDPQESAELPGAPSDALRPGPDNQCLPQGGRTFGNTSIYGITVTPAG